MPRPHRQERTATVMLKILHVCSAVVCGRYLDSNEGWAFCAAMRQMGSLQLRWSTEYIIVAGVDDEDEDSTFTCEYCEQ